MIRRYIRVGLFAWELTNAGVIMTVVTRSTNVNAQEHKPDQGKVTICGIPPKLNSRFRLLGIFKNGGILQQLFYHNIYSSIFSNTSL